MEYLFTDILEATFSGCPRGSQLMHSRAYSQRMPALSSEANRNWRLRPPSPSMAVAALGLRASQRPLLVASISALPGGPGLPGVPAF